MGAIHHLLHPLTHQNGTAIDGERVEDLIGITIAQFLLASSVCWICSCSFKQGALYTGVLTVITFYAITALFKKNAYFEDRRSQLDTVPHLLKSDVSSNGSLATDSKRQSPSSSATTKTSGATSICPTAGQVQLGQRQMQEASAEQLLFQPQELNRPPQNLAAQVTNPQSHSSRNAQLQAQEEFVDQLLVQVQGLKGKAQNLAAQGNQPQLRSSTNTQLQAKEQHRKARVVAGQVTQPQSHSSTQTAPRKKIQGESLGDVVAGVWTTIVGPSHTKAISDLPPDWINPVSTDSYDMKF